MNYAAAVHLGTGHPRAALRETRTALEPVRAYGTEAQIHISHASALLGCGETEGIMDALLPVLAMPAERRMGPVTQRMRELAVALGHGPAADSTGITAARRTLEEWCLDSAPRRLALSSGDGSG
ncbi:hypothetical protein ABCR94_32270 [Streptomyces sp. 21So2-11]|uniref:hypothetical protein n=1 Tax=Streptomyces sp. 21So2-11 TaxID=3144408 RepID=UPI00321BC06F